MARRIASKRRRPYGRYNAYKKRRKMVVPGYTRRTGFYGRFSGPGAEFKFLDTSQGLTGSSSAGVIHTASFNVIPQGNTESNRIGRKCTIKAIQLRGQVQMATTVTLAQATNRIRVIMYKDKQTNGTAVAAVTEILETASVDSFRNLSNSGRFDILMDKTFVLNFTAGNGTGMAEMAKGFQYFKRCNIPIEFDNSATTGVIATQRTNNIGLMTVADGTSTPAALVGYNCRLRYSDK